MMALGTRLYAGFCLSVQVIEKPLFSMEETDVYILRRDYVNAKTCIRHPYQSIRQKVSSELCSGPFVKNAQC